MVAINDTVHTNTRRGERAGRSRKKNKQAESRFIPFSIPFRPNNAGNTTNPLGEGEPGRKRDKQAENRSVPLSIPSSLTNIRAHSAGPLERTNSPVRNRIFRYTGSAINDFRHASSPVRQRRRPEEKEEKRRESTTPSLRTHTLVRGESWLEECPQSYQLRAELNRKNSTGQHLFRQG